MSTFCVLFFSVFPGNKIIHSIYKKKENACNFQNELVKNPGERGLEFSRASAGPQMRNVVCNINFNR